MLQRGRQTAERITQEVRKVVRGLDGVIEEVLVAYFSRGHVLLEGVPGTAKTLLARALSQSIAREFKRLQFTPDLMPVDIIGTRVFDLATRAFHFRPGPVFTEVLLADEINRTPPKTQAALLEAMQERRVTVDGDPLPLSDSFFVIATQNPLEFEGTFPLPESQLDRFMLKVKVPYPDEEAEVQVLDQHHKGFRMTAGPIPGVARVASEDDLQAGFEAAAEVKVHQDLMRYVAAIIRRTRQMPSLVLGASPRAGVNLLAAAKALSMMRGRSYVTPDEIKHMAGPVLRHRLILRPEAEMEAQTVEIVLEEVFKKVEVPRLTNADA
jgi:MoxR-like ATPase